MVVLVPGWILGTDRLERYSGHAATETEAGCRMHDMHTLTDYKVTKL